MAGMFDDLLPAGGAPAPAVAGGGMFDDLLPQAQKPATFDEKFAAGAGSLKQQGPTLTQYATDAVKGIPADLVNAATGMAGIPGDIMSLTRRGLDKILPLPAGVQEQGGIPHPPTSGALTNAAEGVTGPLYESQLAPGRALGGAIGLAPAVLGGPESLASRLLTRAAVPAAAGEAAYQASGGNPLAQIGGTLVGGGLMHGAEKLARVAANPLQAAPTGAELENSYKALYNSPEVTDLRLAPGVGPKLVDKVKTALIKNKLDPINAPQTLATVQNLGKARFESPANVTQTELSGPGFHIANDVTKPAPLQIADFDLTRQSLSDVPLDERRAASIARGVIDDYLGGNIPKSDVVAGDAAAANQNLLAARQDFSANKRATEITNAMGRAENQAGSSYSGGNLENATRQQLRPILNQKTGVAKQRGFQDYTDDEIAALRGAVNGSPVGNTIRTAGKLLGSGHGIGALGTGIAAAEGAHQAGYDPLTSIILGLGAAGAGRGLSRLGAQLETNRANSVANMLRMRSNLGAPAAAANANAMAGRQMLPLMPTLGIQGAASLPLWLRTQQPAQ